MNKQEIQRFLSDFERNPQTAQLPIKKENLDFRPQLIPFRSRDSNGQYIAKATETYKYWRKLLFSHKNNYKKFALLDFQGNTYIATLPYLHCNTPTLQYILDNKWHLQMDTQNLLIKEISRAPEKWKAHIVQKKDKSKNSWIMLHVELIK